MKASDIPTLFGDPRPPETLGNLYSKAFGRFLSGPDVNGTARLVSCYVSEIADLVVFEIDVVLPQHPYEDIRETELIGCLFSNKKDCRPDVLSLRDDFPRLPHQNLGNSGGARSLCLDTTSWNESKFQWSPSSFLEAIRGWLAKAASGTLHARGQPREPLMAAPGGYLILPANADLYSSEKVIIEGNLEEKPVVMWARDDGSAKVPGRGRFRVVCFETPAREHGIIEFLPQNLRELEQLCERSNFDLRQALTENLKTGAIDGKIQGNEFSFNILLVLHHDVTGMESPDVIDHEEWAFMIGEVAVLGRALGVVDSFEGKFVPLMGPAIPLAQEIEGIQVQPVALFRRLNESRSLAASGVKNPYPSVAVIGVGSLGSKVLEVLVRQGLCKASLIDDDLFFPHNTARHSLPGLAVGYKKAFAFAQHLAGIHDPDEIGKSSAFTPIEENFSKITSEELNTALAAADCVLDFSASVSVSRELSARNNIPRCFCAFLTPGADTLFVHQEDGARKTRLDWLELIALRAICEKEKLSHAYTRNSSEIWYGGPCREVSTILPNQNVSLFSAACAGFFTKHHHSPAARCVAYCMDSETMALEAIEIETTEPHIVNTDGWIVKYDDVLVANLKAMRASKLPNETGGVILGAFDREGKICSAVIASDSPSDSKAWPSGYIRGVDGLEKFVTDAGHRTAGQLQYIGEWHSHPRNYPTSPSDTDREALRTLSEKMGREGLPAVMFIVGDDPHPSVSLGLA
jgi:integrative and conjugative element protein (TIGR02256 family)